MCDRSDKQIQGKDGSVLRVSFESFLVCNGDEQDGVRDQTGVSSDANVLY